MGLFGSSSRSQNQTTNNQTNTNITNIRDDDMNVQGGSAFRAGRDVAVNNTNITNTSTTDHGAMNVAAAMNRDGFRAAEKMSAGGFHAAESLGDNAENLGMSAFSFAGDLASDAASNAADMSFGAFDLAENLASQSVFAVQAANDSAMEQMGWIAEQGFAALNKSNERQADLANTTMAAATGSPVNQRAPDIKPIILGAAALLGLVLVFRK